MNKILFNSKEEHWAWVWKNYISLYGKIDEEGRWEESSIWEAEDLPKLEPFFKWQKNKHTAELPMPAEVKESFDHYMLVHEEAGNKRDRKDVCGEIEQLRLVEILGFSPYEDDPDEEYIHDRRYSADNIPELNEDYTISYPCVMVYHLETVWDRVGTSVLAFVDFVGLTEFTQANMIEHLAELVPHNKK
jgi:hypothetical protein